MCCHSSAASSADSTKPDHSTRPGFWPRSHRVGWQQRHRASEGHFTDMPQRHRALASWPWCNSDCGPSQVIATRIRRLPCLCISVANQSSICCRLCLCGQPTPWLRGYSARRVPSGFRRSTSRLAPRPTTATSTAVPATPAPTSRQRHRPGDLNRPAADRVAQSDAAQRPTSPASSPSRPYSSRSMLPTVRVLAPSVLRIAASYTRWNLVIATAPMRIRHAGGQHQAADDGDAERDVADDDRAVSRTSRRVDDRDVGKRRHEVALEARALRRRRPARASRR